MVGDSVGSLIILAAYFVATKMGAPDHGFLAPGIRTQRLSIAWSNDRFSILSSKKYIAIATSAILVIILLGIPLSFLLHSETPSLSAGTNIRLDSFPRNSTALPSNFLNSIQGDEPTVTSSTNGSLYAAWIGLYYLSNAGFDFRSEIFFSQSNNDGQTFSAPVLVSNASDPRNCFDPSIALIPSGRILISYLAESKGDIGNNSVVVAFENNSSGNSLSFSTRLVSTGYGFDRPWIAVSEDGMIVLLWHSGGQIMLTISPNEQLNFTAPTSLNIDINGFGIPTMAWPTGLLTYDNNTLFVSILGQNLTESDATGTPQYCALVVKINGNDYNQVQASNIASFESPYPLNFDALQMFHASPTIAVLTNGSVLVAYPSNDGLTLDLVKLGFSSEGIIVSTPSVLFNSNTTLIQMPWITFNPKGNDLAIAWVDNSTGDWNTYASVYFPSNSSLTKPIIVSDQNGYPSNVLNWHGDFLGVAFVSSTRFVVVWSDGRGSADTYGDGHIYSSIISS